MSSVRILIFLVVLVVLLWLGTPMVITHMIPDSAVQGQFGDLFGAVNALFSGLAFAGLFYTIYLQRQELALQRKELALQRLEMKGSREQLEYQAQAQQSLFRATVAQVRVAEIQAEIEAIKLASVGFAYNEAYSQEVLDASKRIAMISAEFESDDVTG